MTEACPSVAIDTERLWQAEERKEPSDNMLLNFLVQSLRFSVAVADV
jgi:hypothetical protein